MNRVAILMDENGNMLGVAADQPVEFYVIQDNSKHDRVYLYGSVDVGPQHVQNMMQGEPTGDLDDAELGKLPPSRPTLKIVE